MLFLFFTSKYITLVICVRVWCYASLALSCEESHSSWVYRHEILIVSISSTSVPVMQFVVSCTVTKVVRLVTVPSQSSMKSYCVTFLMKAIERQFPVLLLFVIIQSGCTFWLWNTIAWLFKWKLEQYFHLLLFIMLLYKMCCTTFESADEILKCFPLIVRVKAFQQHFF